jgi:hypothetical protein
MAVGLAIAAAGVGSSILGGMSANKKAKKAAKEQAKLTGIMRDEEIRMKKRSAKQQLGAARAGVYASNLQMSGSAKRYVNELDFENMREVAFAEYASKKEQEAIKAGAQGAGNALFAQAAGDALGYAAQAYGNRATSTAQGWGSTPGTVSDPFLNRGEASGAFDESF